MSAAAAEAQRLGDLLEISQALGGGASLRASLPRVLEILQENHGALSASVVLREEKSGQLAVVASLGLRGRAAQRARYRPGEGITGRVVQSGRPIVVPQVSREPLFLNRTGVFGGGVRGELSFVCVPITVEAQTAGALSVALRYHRERRYELEAQFLGVVASLVGQALKAQRLAEQGRERLIEENEKLREELRERHDLHNMVGNSRAMRLVYEQVAQVAPGGTTVLIRGESGTGKEMVAQAIHYGSPRADKPLVKVNCGALPEGLIESELFGYEQGAFTDARARRKGRFELAHGGTLFLDEVGDLSPATQVKLLRVLQEREFERLGGSESVKVNVRLIAATNKDLERAVREAGFREDLYYRLNVFSIFLPPLRERRPDILLLTDYFVQKYARLHGKDVRRVATTAIDMLMAYHWPGNVRELENCVERAVLVCEGGVVHGHHLPPTLQTAEVSGTLPGASLGDAVAAYEKDLILDALKTTRGNRARAARLLDTTERILAYKVRKYGVDPGRFRGAAAAERAPAARP